jgi:hypothetical protein
MKARLILIAVALISLYLASFVNPASAGTSGGYSTCIGISSECAGIPPPPDGEPPPQPPPPSGEPPPPKE